jgi:hypothetical protein
MGQILIQSSSILNPINGHGIKYIFLMKKNILIDFVSQIPMEESGQMTI